MQTKYDDREDHYYSTYDLGILLQNSNSYLEGKLDTNKDAGCYSFFYSQKKFYEKMGLGTEVTIRLEKDEDMEKIVQEYAAGQTRHTDRKEKAMRESGMAKSYSEEYAEYKIPYDAYHSENGGNSHAIQWHNVFGSQKRICTKDGRTISYNVAL